MRDRWFRRRFIVLASGLLVVLASAAVAPGPATRPRYAADGKLEAPEGYHAWVFVGADLSPRYRRSRRRDPPRAKARTSRGAGPAPSTTSTSTARLTRSTSRPASSPTRRSSSWRSTGRPRRTKGRPGERPVRGRTDRVGGRRQGQEAAGRREGLGLLRLRSRGKSPPVSPAAAKPDDMCYTCHWHHASVDNVWVQFYPVL